MFVFMIYSIEVINFYEKEEGGFLTGNLLKRI